MRALSAPIKFTIIRGREIWKQTVGLPIVAGETNEDYRTYALLSRRAEHSEVLYASVQDEPHELVYGMIPLGESISVGEPSAMIDNAGHLSRAVPQWPAVAQLCRGRSRCKGGQARHVLRYPFGAATHCRHRQRGGCARGRANVSSCRAGHDGSGTQTTTAVSGKTAKEKWWWPFGPSKAATNASAGSAAATNHPPDNS